MGRVLAEDERVSQAAKKKVLDAIVRLGYRPNIVGRALAKGRNLSIGLVAWARRNVEDELFSRFLVGIEASCRQKGYGLNLSISLVKGRDCLEELSPQVFQERRVDGFIIFGADELTESQVEKLVRNDIPLVWLTRHRVQGRICCTFIDLGEVYYTAVKHLFDVGCRKIGFMAGDLDLETDRQGLEGFRRAIRDFGLPERKNWIAESKYQSETVIANARRILSGPDRPDGIVAAEDLVANSVLHVCRRLGLGVPDDVAIIGFFDRILSRHTDPPLSTVTLPWQEIGGRAADMLVELCEGDKIKDFVNKTWNPSVIKRGSTDRKAIG